MKNPMQELKWRRAYAGFMTEFKPRPKMTNSSTIMEGTTVTKFEPQPNFNASEMSDGHTTIHPDIAVPVEEDEEWEEEWDTDGTGPIPQYHPGEDDADDDFDPDEWELPYREHINTFRQEKKEDRHGAVAEALYGPEYTEEQRRLAKAINYGNVYGEGTYEKWIEQNAYRDPPPDTPQPDGDGGPSGPYGSGEDTDDGGPSGGVWDE